MNASTWIELIALLIGGGGGSAVGAKLIKLVVSVEKLAVSVEQFATQLRDIATSGQQTAAKTQDHEVRLSVLENRATSNGVTKATP